MYYGGQVIANAQVYFVLWGNSVDPTVKAAMPDFYASIVNSDYMDFLKVYDTTGKTGVDGAHTSNQNIGRGSFLQTIQINPSIVSGKIDDSQIQAELVKQINAGVLPVENANTLYMISFPKGLTITMTDGTTVATSCQQFCAYHEGFQPQGGLPIYYGVIPDLSSLGCAMGCGAGSGLLGRTTVSASHELIEAITDPIPTPGTSPAFPQAWNTTDGQEIGDLCQSFKGTLTGHSATYTIQQEWDNSIGGCSKGNYTAN
jgi:hypothetical protein